MGPRLHLACVLALTWSFGATAYAGPWPHPECQPSSARFNMSLTMGAEVRGGDTFGFAIGLRPEVIFLRRSGDQIGVGPYGEVALTSGDALVAGGASVVLPLGDLAIAPSAGLFGESLDAGWQSGWAVGAFWGWRPCVGYLDALAGLRTELRVPFDQDGEVSFTAAFQFDLAMIFALSTWRD